MPKRNPRVDGAVYVGVDPGMSGGLAAVDETGAVVLKITSFSKLSDREVWEAVYSLRGGVFESVPVKACIEQVGGYVGADRGVPGMGGSMFKFGRSVGFVEACLVASGIEWKRVPPQVWQKGVQAPQRPKGLSKYNFKGLLLQHARTLYPYATVDRSTSDALLIARHCRTTF